MNGMATLDAPPSLSSLRPEQGHRSTAQNDVEYLDAFDFFILDEVAADSPVEQATSPTARVASQAEKTSPQERMPLSEMIRLKPALCMRRP
jgi:hypothetical protein